MCTQAGGEFTTFGCAVLAGQLTDMAGHPLTDISVSFRALRPCNCTEFGFGVEANGEFRQTVHLLGGPDPDPDTVTIVVRAAATGAQYPQRTATTFISDSITAVLNFSPNGELPVITFTQIQLAIP